MMAMATVLTLARRQVDKTALESRRKPLIRRAYDRIFVAGGVRGICDSPRTFAVAVAVVVASVRLSLLRLRLLLLLMMMPSLQCYGCCEET